MKKDKQENDSPKPKEAKILKISKKKTPNPLDSLIKDLEDISKEIETHIAKDDIVSNLLSKLENKDKNPDTKT